MLQALSVFLALFALDFVWARYTYATTEQRPFAASTYGAVIILLSGFGAISYVANPWMLIPACAGAFAGTFVAVKYKKVLSE